VTTKTLAQLTLVNKVDVFTQPQKETVVRALSLHFSKKLFSLKKHSSKLFSSFSFSFFLVFSKAELVRCESIPDCQSCRAESSCDWLSCGSSDSSNLFSNNSTLYSFELEDNSTVLWSVEHNMSSILTIANKLELELVYFQVSSLEVVVLDLEALLLGALLQNQVGFFSFSFFSIKKTNMNNKVCSL
jgi:hypothetical protein